MDPFHLAEWAGSQSEAPPLPFWKLINPIIASNDKQRMVELTEAFGLTPFTVLGRSKRRKLIREETPSPSTSDYSDDDESSLTNQIYFTLLPKNEPAYFKITDEKNIEWLYTVANVVNLFKEPPENFLSPNLLSAHCNGVVLLWDSDHTQPYLKSWLESSSTKEITHKIYHGSPSVMNKKIHYVVGNISVNQKRFIDPNEQRLLKRRDYILDHLLDYGNEGSPIRKRSGTWTKC